MITSFRDRLAVVTGAGSGIGREITFLLAKLGMRLALIDIDGDCLDETAALLRREGHQHTAVRTFSVDVACRQAVATAADDIAGFGGVPALLVNSAGRLGPFDKKAWELSDDDWQGVLTVDLFGVLNMVRAFLPAMRAAGQPAQIVNIASMAGLLPERRSGAYGAAKHALVSFTETLEIQLAEENSPVGVSLVCPGGVPTPFNQALRTADSASGRPSQGLLGAGAVAGQVIEAVRHGTFYVFTHPDSLERLQRYHDRMVSSSEGR